jgi:alpha-ketoglutarate-dependent taurine dioxygenase
MQVDVGAIELSHDGSQNDSKKYFWNYVHLRNACSCATCVDPHSKQRNFRTSDIPPNIQPSSIRQVGGALEIQWENDIPGYEKEHTSVYDTDILQHGRPGSKIPYSKSGSLRSWGREQMKKEQFWITYEDYINNDVEFARAMRNIQKYGLVFIKNIPDSREMVEKVANRIGPVQNTFYGPTWDVRCVPKAQNVACTDKFLGFHMDLLYMKDVPKLQFLHCLKNSCEGGESIFADALRTVLHLAKIKAWAFSSLSSFAVPYQYVHNNDIYYRSRPIIDIVKNDADPTKWLFRGVNYSPPFQGPWLAPVKNDKQWNHAFVEWQFALREFVRLLEHDSSPFELKMQPGTCVVFDNMRIVHARKAFDTSSGERWLAGTYLSVDAVLSRLRVVKRDHPELFVD